MAVYFIAQIGGDGLIKIGKAVDPRARLKQLQTASPYDLRIILVEHGGVHDEHAFHRGWFAHLHERGEWFRRGPELIRFIVNGIRRVEPGGTWSRMIPGYPPRPADIFTREELEGAGVAIAAQTTLFGNGT